MSLCPKFLVELAQKGIIVSKCGKYPYVYHVDKTYRNQKGMADNKRRSIGKLDKTTGMLIPNKTYYAIYEDKEETVKPMQQGEANPSYGGVREVGVIAVVQAIFNNLGIKKILLAILGENC